MGEGLPAGMRKMVVFVDVEGIGHGISVDCVKTLEDAQASGKVAVVTTDGTCFTVEGTVDDMMKRLAPGDN